MLNRPLRFFLTIYNGNETGKGTVSLLLVNRTILSDFFFFNCETVEKDKMFEKLFEILNMRIFFSINTRRSADFPEDRN